MDEQRKEKINKILDIISRVAIALCILGLLVGCIWSCATKKEEEPVTASAATITGRNYATQTVVTPFYDPNEGFIRDYVITFHFYLDMYTVFMTPFDDANEEYTADCYYNTPTTSPYPNPDLCPDFAISKTSGTHLDELSVQVTFIASGFPYSDYFGSGSYLEDLNAQYFENFGELQLTFSGSVDGTFYMYVPIAPYLRYSYTDTTNNYTASSGYDAGYDAGHDAGYDQGYDTGFAEGSAQDYNPFYDLFFALFDAPLTVIQQGFNVELFGVNLAGVITALLSLALIAVIIALVLRR